MKNNHGVQYEEYKAMVQNANSIILVWKTDGIIRFMNNFGLGFFGYTAEELIGANMLGTIISDRDIYEKDLEIMIADIANNPEKYKNNENENITRGGERVWVAWTNTIISNPDTREIEVLSVGNDITARKKAEESLSLFQRLINASGQGFAIVGLDEKFQFVNQTLCDLIGNTKPEDLIGHTIYELFPKTSRDILRNKILPDVIKSKQWTGELDLSQFKKDHLSTIMNFFLVTDENGRPTFIGNIITDISERKRLEEELREFATIDALTKVWNRRFFLEQADRQVKIQARSRRPLAVLMLDIDLFKKINDRFGHNIGDDALKTVSQACLASLRETDLFGRLGGEEFAALLIDCNQIQAMQAAERMRKAVSIAEVLTPKENLRLTISVGVSSSNYKLDLEKLIKEADQAMYNAKETGRDRVCSYIQ